MSLKILYKNKISNGKRFINKIFVAYLISILAIGTIIPIIRSDPGDSWWDPGWNYRKLLTMDTTKISGTLVNFPILVQMTDNDLASYTQSTGNDIVFVLYSDNTTKLNHELEYYNSATGVLYAWVNITRLSSSTNTKIWMYYGNPGCSSQQNKYGTWNSKYKAVYHLDENGLPYVDSTSNKNNITSANVNGTGMAQIGGIYKWLHFNGTTNYLVVPFAMTGAYTIEAIANPDQITASGVVYSNEKTTAPVTGIAMGISSAGVYVTDGTLHRGLSPSSTYTPVKTTKWWADVVFAVGSKIWFYLDGVNRTLTSQSYFINYANYHAIGARNNGKYSAFWDGFIDEVRISSGSWNASWLKTCYDIQKDPASFCSRGDQESAPSGSWVNRAPTFGSPSPVNGSTGVNRYHATNVTVSDLDGNLTTVCFWYGSSISGPWTKAQQNNSVVANTTVRDRNSSYSSGWNTQYWWKVTAFDGHVNSSVIYTFTTKQSTSPSSWWDPGWNYRKLLTMDTTKISGTLVNFPILVQMTDNDLASYTQSTGNDIVFVLYSDNTTKLNHELEYYNSATGVLYAWVNITRLSSSTNTKIWMYYGNFACPNQQNIVGTWDSNYKAVWHLGEAMGMVYDSTSNNNDVSPIGSPNMNVSGKIGKCIDLIPIDYLDSGSATWLDYATVTVEAWVRSDIPTTSDQRIITSGASNTNKWVFIWDSTADRLHRGVVMTYGTPTTVGNNRHISGTYTSVNWYHVVGVRTATRASVYVNGTNVTGAGEDSFSQDANGKIGAKSASGYGFDGKIDEIRVSNIERNASWLKTCYDNQKDPASFCSRGDQESAPSGSWVNRAPTFGSPSPVNGSTGVNRYHATNVTVSDLDGNLTTVCFWYGSSISGPWTKAQQNNSVVANTTVRDRNSSYSSGWNTQYWWKVTAFDGHVNSSVIYTFVTQSQSWVNRAPTFGSPSPVNGSTGVNRYHATNVTVSDLDGNLTTVCFWYGSSISGPWTKAQQNNSVVANTTVRDRNSSYSSGWNTQYWWKVTAFDGHVNSSVIYTFVTQSQSWVNRAPTFGSPSPVNGSTGVNRYHATNVTVSDLDGNLTTVCFWYGSSISGPWTKAQQNNSVVANTTVRDRNSSYSSGWNTQYWWKVTAFDGHVNSSVIYTFVTQSQSWVNSPPVFGTPSPVNDSTGNWLGVPPAGSWIPWNIPINDPEGNRFSWTIQCSNGQTNSGTSPFNGTEYIALSTLSYSTTYKVWVNATDPTGSGLYTRRWYTFTTRRSGNNPPVFTRVPSPENGSIAKGNQLSPSWMNLTWSIRINDLENNSFNWWIQCSNGQGNSSTGAKNGTKSLKLSYLAYSTTYKIWVNATDPTGSGLYIRRWFTFTTKANDPPILGTTSHVNGSIGNSLSYGWWGIFINDLEGNSFSWTIQCSNGQGTSGVGASNGTKTLTLSGLAYSTSYKVWVNATDPTGSGLYTRRWYTFTTQVSGGNNPPVISTPSPVNSSSGIRLSLSWNIQINDPEGTVFSWTIQCSNGQGKNGAGASNGTKTLALSGLAYSTSYKVWVNATDPTGSTLYTRKWYTFTTEPIIPISIPTAKAWSPVTSAAGETRVGAAVADINDDGRMEIIRSGINGIVVHNGTTGAVIWNKLTTMWDSHIPLEIIDLNNDGYLDVISSYSTGTRALSGEDGSQLWYNANAPLYNKHAVVGDIGTTAGSTFINHNPDGYPEVFVCTAGANSGSPQGWVTALTHDGQIFAKVHTYFPCYGGLSLGDTNNDGVYELFMGERSIGYDGNVVGKGVRAFWASNLTERWCHPEMLSSSNCPTLVDTNKDGILEVVALAQTGGNGIAVYNSADGSVIHYSNIPGLRCHSNPTVYDIDGDGNLEIIVGGGSDAWGKPVVWDLYTWSLEAWLPFDCWEPPAIVDLNGDGRVEILECTITNISIFDDNYVFRGSIPLNNNRSGSGYYGMSMIVAQDIDNDNKLELVINRYNQVYVYDTNGAAPTPRALSQFSYYSQHRGRSPYFTQY